MASSSLLTAANSGVNRGASATGADNAGADNTGADNAGQLRKPQGASSSAVVALPLAVSVASTAA